MEENKTKDIQTRCCFTLKEYLIGLSGVIQLGLYNNPEPERQLDLIGLRKALNHVRELEEVSGLKLFTHEDIVG